MSNTSAIPITPEYINNCTLSTCPISLAQVRYDPSLGGNLIYLILFAALLVTHIVLAIRYRTWSFSIALALGLLTEIIGYLARVLMHFNPFLSNPFLVYIICLTIAPVFLTAGIYLCLARLINTYGRDLARFKPRTYTIVFISFDFIALLLQAAGGAMASTSNSSSGQTGINIMIAGLSFQVISLTAFAGLCADFAWRVHKARRSIPYPCSAGLFRAFPWSLGLATLTIYIRSCFRVAELQGGFDGDLANEEIPFMILEGAMVGIACIALSVLHPGVIFGSRWKYNALTVGYRTASGETQEHNKGGSYTVASSPEFSMRPIARRDGAYV